MIIITGKDGLDKVVTEAVTQAQKRAASEIQQEMRAFRSLSVL